MSTFDKFKDGALRELIAKWAALEDIDIEKAHALATAAEKYYKGDTTAREDMRRFQELEQRWYQSLARGKPDYSVYSDQYILSDIWACWTVYSRKYLQRMRSAMKHGHFTGINSVVDLGCGFGYTTACLKELFPSADVYGTQLPDCCQWKLAEAVGKESDFSLKPDVRSLNQQVDLVFASEYFEHWEDPVAHLVEVLDACQPKHLLIANAFGTTSIGHFIQYKGGDGAEVRRVFNRTLVNRGYEHRVKALWNDRPAYWVKSDRVTTEQPLLF